MVELLHIPLRRTDIKSIMKLVQLRQARKPLPHQITNKKRFGLSAKKGKKGKKNQTAMLMNALVFP